MDENQDEIVTSLRMVGASVKCIHMVGAGCPDILVGFRGRNYLFEIKTEGGQLRANQRRWHEGWHGQVAVIRSIEQALAVLGMEVLDK